MTFTTMGFELHAWQKEAVSAWVEGAPGRSFTGTLEIVTGGGKTLIALACAARVAEIEPNLRFAVVVPTEALARQWRKNIVRYTSLEHHEVGLLGAGGKASFETNRVIVAVINTASKKLPLMARSTQPLMLIVDECHRAGAPKYREVLQTPAEYRLGLSATPDREELDDAGEPLAYDEQAVGQALGGVVYRFSLKDAREVGWLPEFTLHHHGVSLSPDERTEYEVVSRRVDEIADELRAYGYEPGRARSLVGRNDETGDAAKIWVQLTTKRKDLLYRARERRRVAEALVVRLFEGGSRPRVILFHERVEEAVELHAAIAAALPAISVGLEHSKLPARIREAALTAFADGEAPILVSVKSLIEGIDVPQADTGISVASTSAVRQRVQALGRVLRRAVTDQGQSKVAAMHLIYVDNTVDELIYSKADWTDLTGAEANSYWRWSYEAAEPAPLNGPPRTPLPTEEQAWEIIGSKMPEQPAVWPGVPSGQEYVVKTNGAVFNSFGSQISNPQSVDHLVALVRGRGGGRFRVTPQYRLVLVWQPNAEPPSFYVAGRLDEPFTVVPDVATTASVDQVGDLQPGDGFVGPADKTGGTFKVSQRAGGVIERKVSGGAEIALSTGTETSDQVQNAQKILMSWERLGRSFSRFFVNAHGHAWYEDSTGRKFLGSVEAGFAWPTG